MIRRIARRDANEKAIVDGLRAAKFHVERLSAKGLPDLLVGDWLRRRWVLLEVKNPNGRGRHAGATEEAQERFFEETEGLPRARVESLSDALMALQAVLW